MIGVLLGNSEFEGDVALCASRLGAGAGSGGAPTTNIAAYILTGYAAPQSARSEAVWTQVVDDKIIDYTSEFFTRSRARSRREA